MLIMSEVRKGALDFNAWGTPCNSLFAPFIHRLLSLYPFSFSYLSLSMLYTAPTPPLLSLPGLWDCNTVCYSSVKARGDELLLYAFNLGLQEGQKKQSLQVPGGTSTPLPPRLPCGTAESQKDLSQVLPSFITLYL